MIRFALASVFIGVVVTECGVTTELRKVNSLEECQNFSPSCWEVDEQGALTYHPRNSTK